MCVFSATRQGAVRAWTAMAGPAVGWSGLPVTWLTLGLLVLLPGPAGRAASSPVVLFEVFGDGAAREGDTVTLLCPPAGVGVLDLPSSCHWFKDGLVIPGQTDLVLTLNNVTRQDTGFYHCQGDAPGSIIKTTGRHVTVKGRAASSPVVLFEVFGDGAAREGDTVTLLCPPAGVGVLDLPSSCHWFKDGLVIPGQTDLVLTLDDVTQQDAGFYHCQGDAPGSIIKTTGRYVGVKVAQFKVHGLDTVREGDKSLLSCVLKGETGSMTRPPSYVWVKDGKVIPGQTKRIIRFKGVTREDAGLYQCGAPGSDVGGEGRHLHVVVAQFKVHGLDTVREGDKSLLSCVLKGETGSLTRPPSYVWVKDGKVIPGQTERIIWFSGVRREDAGLYQCGAPGSDVGGEGRHLHVVVPGGLLPRPTLEHTGLPVCGRPLSLLCLVTHRYIPSADTTYTWYRDHTEVKGQSGPTLSFPNLTEADRGEYTCTAREGPVNTTSPASHAYLLAPFVSPQVFVATQSSKSRVEGVLGENLTLACVVTRASPMVPQNGYSWSYLPSSERQLRHLVGNRSTLTLGPLTREDSGQYFCQARNDQDFRDLNLTGQASATVEVVYPASETRGRHRRSGEDASSLSGRFNVYGLDTVREGTWTFLNCHLEGSDTGSVPRPSSYVWVKDGKVIPSQTEWIIWFKGVTREDAGLYQCGAPGSDVGGEGRHLHVVVLGHILPKPNVEYRGVPICGRPFSIHCIFLEKYIPSVNTVYTWYKDDREVKGQSGQTLSFPNMTETDRGEYVCTGKEGPVNTTSPPSQGYCMVPLVSPQIGIDRLYPNSTTATETPSPNSVINVILGRKLTLICEVDRALPPVPYDGFSWSYLPSSERQLRPLVGKTSTLTLGPLTREDRGQYFCQARNDRDFRDLDLIGNASVTVDVVYLENITLTQDVQVQEGDSVTLTCAVVSHPTARLAWTVNGKKVRHVTYNMDHYVIMSATCSDSNNYTCGASNPDLSDLEINATVQLTVFCKQAGKPVTASTVLPTQLQSEEEEKSLWQIILACILTGLGCAGLIITVVILRRRASRVQCEGPLCGCFSPAVRRRRQDSSDKHGKHGTAEEQEQPLSNSSPSTLVEEPRQAFLQDSGDHWETRL